MTTVRTIIKDALLEIGAIASNQAVEADALEDHLRALNRMIQAWNTEELMVYLTERQLFSLSNGQQSYTLGASGNFNVTRPVEIKMVSIIPTGGPEIPMDILTDAQWRDISVKSTSSSYPLSVWITGSMPQNTLYFWPIPSAACQVALYTWGQVADFASANTTLSFPPGYEEAIVLNLAIRIAPSYGATLAQSTVALAAEAKSRIKKLNWEPTYRRSDGVFSGMGNSIANKTDGYVIDL